MKVNFFSNYFETGNEDRNKEILYSVHQSLNNHQIDRLYILCSNNFSVRDLDNRVSLINIIEKRPTYNDIFSLVNLVSGEDDINIISNVDCFPVEETIITIKDNIRKNDFYCLARWEMTSYNIEDSYHWYKNDSQDIWVCKGPVRITDKKADFCMGTPGCENVLAKILNYNYGYDVSNPSIEIKFYHCHMTNARIYTEADRINRDGNYILVPIKKLIDIK